MVIINPGNPTGQCLSVANLKQIIQFCHQESLVLLGDEVYQQNIYQDERPFISARKVHVLNFCLTNLVTYQYLQILQYSFQMLFTKYEGFVGYGPTYKQGASACFISHCLQRILGWMWTAWRILWDDQHSPKGLSFASNSNRRDRNIIDNSCF